MIVCHCKAVNSKKILTSISAGAKTLKEIMKKTGAGTDCCGCRKTIKAILNEELKKR